MSSASTVRERRKADTPASPSKPKSAASRAAAEDSAFSLLDIARTIVLLALLGGAVSYFVTRETAVFGLKRPEWTRLAKIRSWVEGPKQYTDADLVAYDGTNPDLPLLLALNGSIYDVSAGRRHYGPGGSYHVFAGKDASRAFVTSCFDTDANPDMRGVEEMYIPMDNEEVDSLYTKGQLKIMRQQERKKAKEQVHAALKHWVDFFENSPKYPKIGMVKREQGWETKGPAPTLCKRAAEGRPTSRKRPGEK